MKTDKNNIVISVKQNNAFKNDQSTKIMVPKKSRKKWIIYTISILAECMSSIADFLPVNYGYLPVNYKSECLR